MGKSEDNTDILFAEIINKTLSEYCKKKGYNYSDYEFAVFYGIRKDDERQVGIIAGNTDSSFINDASLRLVEIS